MPSKELLNKRVHKPPRKVMGLGRQLEFYKAAQKARLVQDDVLRYTGVVKNAGLGLWLVFDSLSWAHGAGIVKLSNVKDINRRGYQFWWISIVASLLSDLHRLRMNGIRRQLDQKTLVASNKNKVFQDASVAQQSLTQLEKYVVLLRVRSTLYGISIQLTTFGQRTKGSRLCHSPRRARHPYTVNSARVYHHGCRGHRAHWCDYLGDGWRHLLEESLRWKSIHLWMIFYTAHIRTAEY